jgi:pSer/pThr/pTyr-binding forkhead associated (FHA) protein
MYYLLQVANGPYAGRKIPVPNEGKISIGREESATFAFFTDGFMSRTHAELAQAGADCILHDLESSNGTFLNGRKIDFETLVRGGDRIQIGETQFEVSEETLPVEHLLPQMELDPAQAAAYSVFRAQGLRLYALIDAAANPQILPMLRNGQCNYLALRTADPKSEEFDPYLVLLPPKSALLASLVAEGWNNRWGLYLTTEEGFRKLARHLQETLLAEMRPGGRLPQRFRDALALENFYRSMSLLDRPKQFGPIFSFFTEDPKGMPFCAFTRDGSEPVLGSMLLNTGGDFGKTKIISSSKKPR